MANVLNRKIEAGELLVIRKDVMRPEFQNIEQRFFKASGNGSGCESFTMGSAVTGEFFVDGEKARYEGDEDFSAAETLEWQEKLGRFGEGVKEFLAAIVPD